MRQSTTKSRLAYNYTEEDDLTPNPFTTPRSDQTQQKQPRLESQSALIERVRRKSRVSKPPISSIHLAAIRNRQALKNQRNKSEPPSKQSHFIYHDEASSSMVSFASVFNDRWRSRQGRSDVHSKGPASRASFLETVLNEVYEISRQPGLSNDPFSRFPAPWRPVFAPILDYYHSYCARALLIEFIAGWGGIELSEILSWPFRATIAMAEPALFYSTLATTSMLLPDDHPLSTQNAPLLSSNLAARTVEELNVSMANSGRKCSHSIIHTILTIVLAESLQGRSESAQRTLLPAVKYVVLSRGGLDNLAAECTDGRSLVRMILWIDRIISSSLNLPPCFEGLPVAEKIPQHVPSLEYIFRERHAKFQTDVEAD